MEKMGKSFNYKFLFIAAILSFCIFLYQIYNETYSTAITSIFYCLTFLTIGINRMIIVKQSGKTDLNYPPYYLLTLFLTGTFFGAGIVYLIFTEFYLNTN